MDNSTGKITIIAPDNSSNTSYGAVRVSEVAANNEEFYYKRRTRTLTNAEVAIDVISIASNTLNALLGVSLFAMPWGFMQSGVFGGSLIVSVVAALSFETARILLVAQRIIFSETGEIKGYPEIAASALGPAWHYVVQVATIISCIGGCTGYMIFFGQTLGQVFGVSDRVVLLSALVPLILLSWIKGFQELAIFTVLGVIFLFVTVIILIKDGIETDSADGATDPIIFFNFVTMLNFVGPATFSFTIHYCVLSIGEECLKLKPSYIMQMEENMNIVFNSINSAFMSAYITSFFLIALVGGGCFVFYRQAPYVRDSYGNIVDGCEDRVCQNVILNISPGILRNIVGVAMSLVIMMSYIVILAPAREHLESYALKCFRPQKMWHQDLVQKSLRASLVIFNVTVAMFMPYFGGVVGTVGGLTDALQCFVLPPLIFRAVVKDPMHPVLSIFYYVVLAWGCFTIAYTLVHVVQQLTLQRSDDDTSVTGVSIL